LVADGFRGRKRKGKELRRQEKNGVFGKKKFNNSQQKNIKGAYETIRGGGKPAGTPPGK